MRERHELVTECLMLILRNLRIDLRDEYSTTALVKDEDTVHEHRIGDSVMRVSCSVTESLSAKGRARALTAPRRRNRTVAPKRYVHMSLFRSIYQPNASEVKERRCLPGEIVVNLRVVQITTSTSDPYRLKKMKTNVSQACESEIARGERLT